MELINTNNESSNHLYGYDDFFLYLVNLYNNKKLPNKIIFSGPKGIGKCTFAYHLINYIFSKNEDLKYNLNNFIINKSNKSYNLVINNTHPNFFLIDLLNDNKVIEISQIREMINYANKSSFNNKEKIILINNAEYLNLSSSNALLKIVEEPNNNIIFLLICDSSKKIIDTLKSRCLKFNFNLSFNECINITNKIIQKDISELINKDLIYHYSTVGDLINIVNFSASSKFNISNITLKDFLINIIDEKYYKSDMYIKNNIFKYIELYLFKLIDPSKSQKQISLLYENFVNKIYYLKKFNLDEESFFIEFKAKVLNG